MRDTSLLLVLLAVVSFQWTLAEPTSLRCYTCDASSEDGSCDQKLTKCPSVFQACQTVVSPGKVEKSCRSLVDCWRAAQTGCVDGTCSYCCDEDECNVKVPRKPGKGRVGIQKASQNSHDACDPNPCHNGGTCENLDDGGSCKTGKTGKSCNKTPKAKRGHIRRKELRRKFAELKRGKTNKSKNKTPKSNPEDHDDFICHCEDGYSGTYCEVYDGHPCDSHPCHNGGTCHHDGGGYWCECPNGYEGQHCEIGSTNPCDSHPCHNGGTCHHDGNGYWCECPNGYQGQYCEIGSTNPCDSHPCHNGGTCHHDGDGYWCECPSGYEGRYCEIGSTHPCDSHPCHNGGTCHHDGDGYWCECQPGYQGYRCETATNPCSSDPCQHGGTCHEDGGGYWCECHPGYQGHRCETATSPCDSHPCLNGGSCHQDDGSYWCECPPDYEGRHCEYADDPCNPNPCHNGGTCELDEENSRGFGWLPGGSHSHHKKRTGSWGSGGLPGFFLGSRRSEEYICHCQEGYYGKDCETNNNPCDPNPCQHGGSCHFDSGDLLGKRGKTKKAKTRRRLLQAAAASGESFSLGISLPWKDDYMCECTDGYHGEHCEHVTTPCSHHPCKNGGTCHEDGDGYYCTCLPNYEGHECQTMIEPCNPNPCQNGGTCDEDRGIIGRLLSRELKREISLSRGPDDYFECRCPRGYYGDYCEKSENPCDPNPCQNGGTCDHSVSEESSELSIIESHLTRKKRTLDFLDDSDEDKSGDNTESHSSFGSSDSNEDYYCYCRDGYWGKNCDETEAPCSSNPCQHGATCHQDDHGHWCECAPGYVGSHCEIPINPCDLHPCQNGGTCHNHGEGTFVCECPSGYEGTYCEYPTNPSHPCDSHPCHNGGTCHDDGHGGYWCDCTSGYEGQYCDQPSNPSHPCDSHPCHNGGTCHDDGHGGYWCDCTSSYQGPYCDEPINQPPPPSGGYDCETNNPCTEENIENGDLYWPHEDPTKFVQCDLWGGCYVMNCPEGMEWNQEVWECVNA